MMMQYLLGPKYLVAPVTTQNATSRKVYFPAGASWRDINDQVCRLDYVSMNVSDRKPKHFWVFFCILFCKNASS
jgi:hypothetical protein